MFRGQGLTLFDFEQWEFFLKTLLEDKNRGNIQEMKHFYEDAAAGTLPTFTWINPRAGINVTTLEGAFLMRDGDVEHAVVS